MNSVLAEFQNIQIVDFEFSTGVGERPTPICMVAYERNTKTISRCWEDQLSRMTAPPYGTGQQTLFVAYYAPAEMGCHRALHWRMPLAIVDLYAEFRMLTNGVSLPFGAGLLGACQYFGIPTMAAERKDEMRATAMRGGSWTFAERNALTTYCEQDVMTTAALFERMLPRMNLPYALLRGRYMAAVGHMEDTGIPIDTEMLALLRDRWDNIKDALIARVDQRYGVFERQTFKADRLERLLAAREIPWPRLPSGALSLDDDVFRERAQAYPELTALRELRVSLSKLRLVDLAVGRDGRNRTMLSAFRAKTGRNQPSTTRFVFGPSTWIRGLIRPAPGCGLAYVDWEQQEFGIAAALSGDSQMLAAYETGDPYLAFAKQARAVPDDATKETHGTTREQFKACALGVQYGMGIDTLARRIGQSPAHARALFELHRAMYPRFWKWSDGVLDYAMLHERLYTAFGLTLHIGSEVNPRSLRNFPMQANGAEMLRLACCLCTEAGIAVCAPIHDALLVEARLEELDATVARTQQLMAEASAAVLGGFRLRSDAAIVRYPDRYQDPRGVEMWNIVVELLNQHGTSGT